MATPIADADGQAHGQTHGAVVAGRVADAVGSWRFIGGQAALMAVWVAVNALAVTRAVRFDAYPFVFLNLAMSAEAAFTGPILLIAANVAATRDRAQAARVEALTAHMETLVEQVGRIARADHVQHGRLLADLHSHTVCAGHTEIRSGPGATPPPPRRGVAP